MENKISYVKNMRQYYICSSTSIKLRVFHQLEVSTKIRCKLPHQLVSASPFSLCLLPHTGHLPTPPPAPRQLVASLSLVSLGVGWGLRDSLCMAPPRAGEP